MIVGITASRKGPTAPQKEALVQVMRDMEIDQWHHGGCVGGDHASHFIALALGFYTVVHRAKDVDIKWLADCPGANEYRKPLPPMERNDVMLGEIEHLVVMPWEFEPQMRSGTWATARHARKMRLGMTPIYPNGDVVEWESNQIPVSMRSCTSCGNATAFLFAEPPGKCSNCAG